MTDTEEMLNAMVCTSDAYFIQVAYDKGYEDAKPKWISVEDRLPDDGREVMLSDGYSRVLGCKSGGGWSLCGYDVTHWMPLPDVPTQKS